MAALNPMDFLLWLSEELETRDWDSATAGTQMGLAMNFVFLLARANSGSSTKSDDIFSDETSSGWLSFLVYPLVWILAAFSFTNAFYTITRTRKYRLFLAKVDKPLSTPSARRVKVNQSSASPSTPLSYLANLITPESAESRAYPDKASDVWELSIWDPLPVSLRLACLFGPGHVLIYMIFLPLAPLDPRPSVTVLNTLLLQILFSAQLLFFCSRFAQQAKDKAVIQEQVMREYDTKFVHPRLHPTVRDIGTQFSPDEPSDYNEFVQTGTPTVQIRHGFQTHSNPYTGAVDTLEERSVTPTSNNVLKPHMFTPPTATRRSEAFRPATSQRSVVPRQSLPSGYTSTGTSSGVQGLNFGGNMGIHTHNKSPLKKATSLHELNPEGAASPRNSREMAAYEQRNWGAGTPSKKVENRRLTSSKLNGGNNPFAGLNRQQAPSEGRRPLCLNLPAYLTEDGQDKNPSMATYWWQVCLHGNCLKADNKNPPLVRHEHDRRLTMGNLSEWLRERQEPARSVTLGDLGDWLKSKLPSHRPERGGTSRNKKHQGIRVTNGIESSRPTSKDIDNPSASLTLPEQRHPLVNRRTGERSGTGGSDRLVDWNTPKNLSEVLPDRSSPSPQEKAVSDERPAAHQKWTNFNSLISKRNPRAMNGGIGSEKDRRGRMQRNAARAQASTPALQIIPGILEVLEATRQARKKARDDRESLIESGDYLGVQGINLQTGVLDLTSDSGESVLSVRTGQRLAKLEARSKNANSAVERKEAEIEIIKIYLDHDIVKLRRREETEKQLAAVTTTGKWRKGTHEWSSVQEPDLSPIAQSHKSDSAPSIQLLQRRQASRVGTKADPLLQKEAERSVTRDPLTALPFPTGEATAWLGLRNLPKTEKEIQASENIVRKNLTQLNLLYQAILEIKDHGNHEICAQNTNQGTANMYEVKEACASINTVTTGCARTTSTFPQKKERQIQESLHHKRRLNRVVRNLRYFGTTPSNVDISQTNRGVNTLPKSVSLKQIPVADAVSENSQAQACNNEGSRAEIPATQHQCSSLSTFTCTVDDKNVKIEETELSIPRRSGTQLGNERLSSATHRIGLNEQAMNLGVQMSGDLQKDQDAEDAIADLSSNDHGSSEKGGLWEAIMEFLRTISEYSLWLLRLYVGA
ncbi:hypothetical protein ACLX1H_003776 [Fusarium chlamydosporum]